MPFNTDSVLAEKPLDAACLRNCPRHLSNPSGPLPQVAALDIMGNARSANVIADEQVMDLVKKRMTVRSFCLI